MAGRWEQVTIDGKVADVFEPTNLSARPTYGVLFFHGHGRVTLKDNAEYSQQFDDAGWPVVCPHGERSWWLDRICAEFDEELTPIQYLRESVIPYFKQRWGLVAPSIGLLGISMGGQGALQFAYRFAREFPSVAAISPLIDLQNMYGQGLPLDDMFESAESARQQSVTLQLHPLNWPRNQFLACDPADQQAREGVERLASKLFSSGIPFESDFETTRDGHNWGYFNGMAQKAIDFLRQHVSPGE